VTSSGLTFEHIYNPAQRSGAPTLLMLHGTGGNEHDLLPVARMLDPSAAVLSPRGQVLENGMPRFFRRLAEGVFDVEDLKRRASDLATFTTSAAAHYGFDPDGVVAVGFSNGANIAAAVLLLHPGTLARAVLFRAMVPLVPDPLPSLAGATVLISNGRGDPIISGTETERLASLLRACGADVELAWQPGGHELTRADVATAQTWLGRIPSI
jgi:predicted esterase